MLIDDFIRSKIVLIGVDRCFEGALTQGPSAN